MSTDHGDRLAKGESMDRVTVRVPDRLLDAVGDSEFPNRSAAVRAGMRAAVDLDEPTDPVERVLTEVDAVADEHGVDTDGLVKAVLAEVRKRGAHHE